MRPKLAPRCRFQPPHILLIAIALVVLSPGKAVFSGCSAGRREREGLLATPNGQFTIHRTSNRLFDSDVDYRARLDPRHGGHSNSDIRPHLSIHTSRYGSVPIFRFNHSQNGQREVESVANLFIRRWRETLDFGVVFAQMSVPDAIERLRKTEEFQSIGLSEELASQLDADSARRLYHAFMNFYYLNSTFMASTKGGLSGSGPPKLPAQLRKEIERSRYLRGFLAPGSYTTADPPKVTNSKELENYVNDLERIARIYRRHLPRNVYASATYRRNILLLETERGHHFEIMKGNSYFQVPESTNVYLTCRDVFCLYFMKWESEMRLLGVTIGN